MASNKSADPDVVYRRIGEFIVAFQWLEHRLREIGWLIVDPTRTEWPPRSLRTESNAQLIDRVVSLYGELMASLDIDKAGHKAEEFKELGGRCHYIRKQRNRLVHSAFVELKVGGEVDGLVRSNPRLEEDPETGEPLFDQELLRSESFVELLREIGEIAGCLNMHYLQLIHWAPFEKLKT